MYQNQRLSKSLYEYCNVYIHIDAGVTLITILEYLEDMEDYYFAEERLKSFNEAITISLEDIMKRYGLED